MLGPSYVHPVLLYVWVFYHAKGPRHGWPTRCPTPSPFLCLPVHSLVGL